MIYMKWLASLSVYSAKHCSLLFLWNKSLNPHNPFMYDLLPLFLSRKLKHREYSNLQGHTIINNRLGIYMQPRDWACALNHCAACLIQQFGVEESNMDNSYFISMLSLLRVWESLHFYRTSRLGRWWRT